jgi:outer membrane protein OmpA-like peptidoglycan-associated protein
MKWNLILTLLFCLSACTGTRSSLVEQEEQRRAKLETQNINQMLDSKQLPPIEFDFDSAKLKEKYYPILDKIAQIMLKHKKLKLVIEGHCDDIGSDDYNYELALMRAEAVKNYIVGKGIYPDSIRTFGYGKRKRIFDDVSERARALKRRVELMFTYRTWESIF